MTTITVEQELNLEKNNFKTVEDLIIYLNNSSIVRLPRLKKGIEDTWNDWSDWQEIENLDDYINSFEK